MKDQIAPTLTREDVTSLILAARKARGLSWEGIAQRIGMSPVFTHSACMGMKAFPADKAQALVAALDLPADAADLLSEPPTKIWSQAVPTDPRPLSPGRDRRRLWPYHQGADRGEVRHRHHVRPRFRDVRDPRDQRQRRPRQAGDVGQVSGQ